MFLKSHIALSLTLLIYLSFSFSCKVEECDEVAPIIEFKSFQNQGDTGILIVTFKDCDGDIGLTPSDTAYPYDFNYFVEYFELIDGEWVFLDLNVPFNYRIPPLETGALSKIREGEIEVKMLPRYYIAGGKDTFRYEIYLKDLALNVSNRVVTPMIVAPR
jgi:hypothetical protein